MTLPITHKVKFIPSTTWSATVRWILPPPCKESGFLRVLTAVEVSGDHCRVGVVSKL